MRRNIFLALVIAIVAVMSLLSFPVVGSANHVQCSDGVDNDTDGKTDFPADTDCSSTEDPSEFFTLPFSSSPSTSSLSSVSVSMVSSPLSVVDVAAFASSSPSSSMQSSSVSAMMSTVLSASSVDALPTSVVTLQANIAEVVANGDIRYTISVRNVTDQIVDDAVVTAKFDPSQAAVMEQGTSTILTSGQLQWNVSPLSPGQSWQASYVLRASSTLTTGSSLGTVVSVAGSDLSALPLNQKVAILRTSVVGRLPTAGAPLDVFALIAIVMMSSVAALLQRRFI